MSQSFTAQLCAYDKEHNTKSLHVTAGIREGIVTVFSIDEWHADLNLLRLY